MTVISGRTDHFSRKTIMVLSKMFSYHNIQTNVVKLTLIIVSLSQVA